MEATAEKKTLTVTIQEDTKLTGEASDALVEAQGYHIDSDNGLIEARDKTAGIKALINKIKNYHKPMKRDADQVKKTILDAERSQLSPLEQAEKIYKGKMSGYLTEKEKKEQKAAEDRAEEEQKKKDRLLKSANKKIDKLMENTKDSQVKRDNLQTLLDTSEDMSDEEAQVIREKIRALDIELDNIQNKVNDTMEKVEETAGFSPASVGATQTKVAGMSQKKVKTPTEVTNMRALLQAIIAGTIPEKAIKPNMGEIKKLLNMDIKVPGVKYTEDLKLGVRT